VTKLFALSAIALTLATGTAFGETLTGVVSDAMCAKNPTKASSPDHAACAKKCINGGSPAVLIVSGKVYQVANATMLNAYAGKTVTVDGTVDNDVLTVKSVK
jgi:hypothetical protein